MKDGRNRSGSHIEVYFANVNIGLETYGGKKLSRFYYIHSPPEDWVLLASFSNVVIRKSNGSNV